MSDLHSYSKVYNLGHPALARLFDGPVVVQEKVDGSQFSFGRIGDQLLMRSKGATVYPETADKGFRAAADTAISLFERGMLSDGWVYRGEVLSKPKHNTLAYDRVPEGNIILFDVDTTGMMTYLNPDELKQAAYELGLEAVPYFWTPDQTGNIDWLDFINVVMGNTSVLGGQTIEGLVFKNYAQFDESTAKTLMGKHVSEAFKEVHRGAWKAEHPGRGDIIEGLIATYRTPARWNKAVQHLRESGLLTESPKDIGALIKEVHRDTREECEQEIRDALWQYAWPKIQRGLTGGLPEHYKDLLMRAQFESENDEPEVVKE